MVCIVPMWYIDKFYKQLFITPTMADNKTKTPLKRRTRRTKKQMQEDKEKAAALLPMDSLFNINAVDNLALLPHLPLTHYLNVPCSAGELPLPFTCRTIPDASGVAAYAKTTPYTCSKIDETLR